MDTPKKICKVCKKPISYKATYCGSCWQLGDKNPIHKRSGSKHHNWKEKPSYIAIHTWVRRHKQMPEVCEWCKKDKPLQAANISGKYKREIDDYIYLCVACHVKQDGRIENISKSNGKKIKSSSGGVYDTLLEAHEDTGISRTAINNCLRGLSKTAGKMGWKYV